MRSFPCRWMFGSVAPSASTRRLMTSIDWSTARRTLSVTPASVMVEAHEAVIALRHVERARAAEARVADRLAEIPERPDDAGALGRIGNAHLDAARGHRDAAGKPDLLVVQDAPHIVAQLIDLGLRDRGRVDLQKHMRAALQIEPEHDPLMRQQAGRQEAETVLERVARALGKEIRHHEEKAEHHGQQHADDLGSRIAQHRFNFSFFAPDRGKARRMACSAPHFVPHLAFTWRASAGRPSPARPWRAHRRSSSARPAPARCRQSRPRAHCRR